MNPSFNKALVVGGGIAGMCAAIQLRKAGVQVDLLEADRDWRVYGAGISITGATLRAFQEVGVLDAIQAQGWCTDGVRLFSPDGAHLVGEIPTPRIAGPEVPGGGAILRPVLARILSQATLASGTAVRCGVSFTELMPDGEQVRVCCSDGRTDRYDLVIGADGLFSKVREAVFPAAPAPSYTGQNCWRAVLPRDPAVERPHMYLGQKAKAGLNPVSADEMYLFVLDSRPAKDFIDPADWPQALAAVLAEFGGIIGRIRDGLGAHSRILYRPLEKILLPPPWHQGRVVLIGDAAHATTPHLASGAGMAVEDALVLVQELQREAHVALALQAFAERRYPRARMVVENSLRLGELEQSPDGREAHGRLMGESMRALCGPI